MNKSSITPTFDLSADGRHVGDLRLKWSDNSVPLGYHPIPVISIKHGTGPVVLLTGGTHGDEFEGPSALMRLANDIDPDTVNGQIILIPGLNAPALEASSRVSPLDAVNLNRAFPGDPKGGITEQIAHYVESVLLPMADAAVDLHSGGKASYFQPCTLATRTEDPVLFRKNLALAQAFDLPLTWILGRFNDDRSFNAAAARAGVPMIATELGGGGGVDPAITDAAERGLYRLLQHLGVLGGAQPTADSKPLMVEITSSEHSLFAEGEALFDRQVSAGQSVQAGQEAGRLHYVSEPRRPSERVLFRHDGYVLAHTNRGYVKRGDMLMLVVQPV